ncbi:MAG TPA: thioredoxin domain-containing protein [Thermomicrobiaceae bacterium]|nr:thioredoxin domain-containing protein [Thermomicrobiaceae bacterium]
MPNRLQHERSPYLRQHATNPVDWYPWGSEALERARAEDRPILLSIGYSACHWCHVMAHESFENPAIAGEMNRSFVNIKVDREERPDLDTLYMAAVQMLTGSGGWPMTVFLTPDGRPFYGGTYYPPEDRAGMPGFPRVLEAVLDAYRERRGEVDRTADEISGNLGTQFHWAPPPTTLTVDLLDEATRRLTAQFDPRNGGFGGAPKFPPAMALEFLLRQRHRTGSADAGAMLDLTLERMARGGIHDQIGGGFHRYAVDAVWLVPHFEKMLYDNALLARAYTLAHQATGHRLFRQVAEDAVDYVLREMTSPEGGFYATQDADSEGVEGKFYLWTPAEIDDVLGPRDGAAVSRFFGVTPGGNFDGRSILHVPESPDAVAASLGIDVAELARVIAAARPRLYAARAGRVWPGRDDKVLTGWNGLMLRALAEAGTALARPDVVEAAVRNARFIRAHLVRDGRLLRVYQDGEARVPAYLEDHAALAAALVSLYEATFDVAWIVWARDLAREMLDRFWDDASGAFFDTPADQQDLIVRPRDVFDSATPSGNALAAETLLRLAWLLGDDELRRRATAVLEQFGPVAAQHPTGFGALLTACDSALADAREVAIVGDPDEAATQALLATVRRPYLPHKVVALAHSERSDQAGVVPLLADRGMVDGVPTAYVCEGYTCKLPVTSPEALAAELGLSAGSGTPGGGAPTHSGDTQPHQKDAAMIP